jgi:PAS domain S-box-containing protein
MRTKYAICCISLVLASLLPVELSAQTLQKNKSMHPVRIGYIDFSPIYFRNSNDLPDGSFIAIIKLWSHQSKTPIKLVYFDEWKKALAALEKGSIDLLPGVYRTPEREKRYLFSKPMAVFREDLFIRKATNRSEINKAVFGVIQGTYREKWLRQDYPLATFKLCKNPTQLVAAFAHGNIQVFAMNQNSGTRHLNQIGMQLNNQFRVQPYRTLDSCMVAMPGNEKLIKEFNVGLKRIGQKDITSILRAWQTDKLRQGKTFSRPINIVYSKGLAPYQYADSNDKAAGFCPEFWRRFAFENNITINFIGGANWSQSLAMLYNGKADLHCGMFYSEKRGETLAFTKPYLSTKMALYIDDSISGINELSDISGFIVGCEKGTMAATTLLRHGILSKQYENSQNMLDDFISGKIKATLMLDEFPDNMKQLNHKQKNFYKIILKKQHAWHGAALRKNKVLIDRINKLMVMTKKPTIKRIKMWTIGVPLGQPPMSFATREGAVLGAVPEFWRLMAEKKKFKVRFVIGNWLQLRQWLKDGRIDFIGLSPGSYNEAAWLRSIPFGMVCYQQLYSTSKKTISSGEKIGVLLPSSIAAALQYPALRLQAYNSEKKMIEDLKKGDIAGFFIDEKLKGKIEAYYILDKPLNAVLDISFKNNYVLLYPSRRGLPSSVREIMASPEEIQTFKNIVNKWLAESSLPWKQIITSAVIALVFLALLIIWILQLKREIRCRVTITGELRQREAELRIQQDQFHMVEHAASMGTWQINLEQRICYFNETTQELLGLPVHQQELRFDDEFIPSIHPDDQAGILYNIVNNLNAPLLKNTFRYIKQNKEVVWIHSFGSITEYDSDSVPLILTGFFQDISAKVKAEEESQQQHMLIDSLVKNIPFGLACSDPQNEFKLTFWNPVMESLTGIKARKAIGHDLQELLPEGYKVFNREVSLVMTQRSKIENIREITLNGENLRIRFCLFPILDYNNEIKLIVTMLEDVTEKVDMEERYRLSQKMEALGRLAGGIAHDFNNFLQTIHGHAEMLKDAELTEPYSEDVGEILNAAERGAALTAQLLIFSHTDSMEKKRLELNEFISDMYKIIKRLVRADIAFNFKTGKDKIYVHGTPGTIGQIVLNLCLNSSDAAAEDNAFINISISKRHISSKKDVDSPDARTGDYALLTVADNGSGISNAVQETIFDPFFTTKTPNEGTGMGLATVYAIVKSHRGFIELKSEPGNTVFNIHLPLMREPAETIDTSSLGAVQEGQTILLAEDDPSIRAMATRILTQAGYSVIEAANGNEAVDLFMKNRNRIDLMMSDVVMPGKSGEAACREILKENPDLPLIYCSGYSKTELENDYALNPKNRLLCKPYGIHDLLVAVRDVLGPPGDKV